jgi:ribosomal protein S14
MTAPNCPACGRPALAFDLHLAGVCCQCIREQAATLGQKGNQDGGSH